MLTTRMGRKQQPQRMASNRDKMLAIKKSAKGGLVSSEGLIDLDQTIVDVRSRSADQSGLVQ
ncbi:hypothetical protein H8F24_11300 [Synechococcus sp. CBW1002]|nr:hypothetical protein H8F24_11300 [Synechococcus sp. CBW1002]